MSRDQPPTRYPLPPPRDPGRPFPAVAPWDTEIDELSGWWLEIDCGACDVSGAHPLRLLAARHGWKLSLRTVVSKLNCSRCRLPPTSVELIDTPQGDAGRYGATTRRLVLARN